MSNRAAKYELLHKSLKKHFKPIPEVGERTVLEHLIYACCLEEAKAEQADEAFAKLQQAYFDWNEVRVTTVIELGEALTSLPNPAQAGHRIKRCLQSLFEARYQYDIEDMKKANLGKATDELTAWKGVSSFILNYVSQNALGGHAIPADALTLECLVNAEIITEAEAEKKSLPGIERAIPKSKGCEFASLLHQFSVEFHSTPKSPTALAVFKDLGVTPKPKAKVQEKPAPAKLPKVATAPTISPVVSTPTSKSKSSGPAPVSAPEVRVPAPAGRKTDKPSATPAATTKHKDAPVTKQAPTKLSTKSKSDEPVKSDAKKSTPRVADKKSDVNKPNATKTETKPAGKKPMESPKAKATDSTASAKKPVEPKKASPKPAKQEPSKTKATPPKASGASAGKTKSSPRKEATNVKITKKKPR